MLEIIKKLESSKEFKEYNKKNQDIFLAHVFYMIDDVNKDVVQIGYYNKKTEMIVTFIIEKDKITMNPEEKVFKEQKTAIKKLDLANVKIDVNEALEIAEDIQKQKYSAQIPVKRIAILQHLPVGQVWNITCLTQSFKTLNIKIDSGTKKIVSDSLISVVGDSIS